MFQVALFVHYLYVRNNCYLCLIAKKSIGVDYKALVCYMLPEGILDSFEITGFKEEVTSEKDETGTVIKIQKAHAGEWMLPEGNIGESLSIDETMHWLRLLK